MLHSQTNIIEKYETVINILKLSLIAIFFFTFGVLLTTVFDIESYNRTQLQLIARGVMVFIYTPVISLCFITKIESLFYSTLFRFRVLHYWFSLWLIVITFVGFGFWVNAIDYTKNVKEYNSEFLQFIISDTSRNVIYVSAICLLFT